MADEYTNNLALLPILHYLEIPENQRTPMVSYRLDRGYAFLVPILKLILKTFIFFNQ